MKKIYMYPLPLKALFMDCFVPSALTRLRFLAMTAPGYVIARSVSSVAIQASSSPLSISASVLLCAFALGGCDTFRNTFGLDHYRPDEWSAEPSPGLILPPDFAQRPKLPPPAPGAPNPHVVPETVKAQKTVLGDEPSMDTSLSTAKGERDIIEKASENQPITPNIREVVDEESQTDSTVSSKVIAKIRSWKKEAARNLGFSQPKATDSATGSGDNDHAADGDRTHPEEETSS